MTEAERKTVLRERLRLLHVYGQVDQHAPAEIVGNRAALTVLRDAIDAALAGDGAPEVSTSAMTADGEGFMVSVLLDDRPWEHPAWETRPPVSPIS